MQKKMYETRKIKCAGNAVPTGCTLNLPWIVGHFGRRTACHYLLILRIHYKQRDRSSNYDYTKGKQRPGQVRGSRRRLLYHTINTILTGYGIGAAGGDRKFSALIGAHALPDVDARPNNGCDWVQSVHLQCDDGDATRCDALYSVRRRKKKMRK